MKLQVAIDRVELKEAEMLAKELNGKTDIVEMGTSLVKDYGVAGMEAIRQVLTNSELLIDVKTIDEGAYEFKQGYKYGGDILTVMGAASIETIQACYEVSQKEQKEMMIDLLEVTDEKIAELLSFDDAIFCLHHSIDKKQNWNVTESIQTFRDKFPSIPRLAIAGGIGLEQTQALKEQGLTEIVIVGSNITKSINPNIETIRFMEAVKNGNN